MLISLGMAVQNVTLDFLKTTNDWGKHRYLEWKLSLISAASQYFDVSALQHPDGCSFEDVHAFQEANKAVIALNMYGVRHKNGIYSIFPFKTSENNYNPNVSLVVNLLITSSFEPKDKDAPSRYHVDYIVDFFGICRQSLHWRLKSNVFEFCLNCLAPLKTKRDKIEHLHSCRSGDPKLVFPESSRRLQFDAHVKSFPTQVKSIRRRESRQKNRDQCGLTFFLLFLGIRLF